MSVTSVLLSFIIFLSMGCEEDLGKATNNDEGGTSVSDDSGNTNTSDNLEAYYLGKYIYDFYFDLNQNILPDDKNAENKGVDCDSGSVRLNGSETDGGIYMTIEMLPCSLSSGEELKGDLGVIKLGETIRLIGENITINDTINNRDYNQICDLEVYVSDKVLTAKICNLRMTQFVDSNLSYADVETAIKTGT